MRAARIPGFVLAALLIAALLAACGGRDGDDRGPAQSHTLTVTVEGTGEVLIDDLDWSCSDECTLTVGDGVPLELTVSSATRSAFAGWGGACSGSDSTCPVVLDDDATVQAAFANHAVVLEILGEGDAEVLISPASGGPCTDSCTKTYTEEMALTISLTAYPEDDTRVVGWGGACAGTTGPRCLLAGVSGINNVTLRLALITHRLNVETTGSGTVTSTPGGIDCGSDCTETFTHGTSVILTANPNPGHRFVRFAGCDSASGNTCTVSIDEAKAVEATFEEIPPEQFTLTVQAPGQGTVTSDPGGINCGDDCSASFEDGTNVVLTATPNPGYRLDTFEGCDSTTGNTCTVSMDEAKAVEATFEEIPPEQFTLTVQAPGQGTVTSDPGGINCGEDCSESFIDGTVVTLTAAPNAGYRLNTFEGCDSTSGNTCTVTMNATKTVEATFEEIPPGQFTLTVDAEGPGTVTSDPGGINCPGTCDADFTEDTSVTLIATPNNPGAMISWSECTDGNPTCNVEMDSEKTVSVVFAPAASLTVALEGPGEGSVVSSPTGIDCGTDCEHDFEVGETVTLNAIWDDAVSIFSGWSGEACAGFTGATCVFDMPGPTNVAAEFGVKSPSVLAVEVSGNGFVRSHDGNIDSCMQSGGTCTAEYESGAEVTLEAIADWAHELEGWDGCDDSGSACTLEMTENRIVTAHFVQDIAAQATFKLEFDGDGAGSVASTDGSFNCEGTAGTLCEEVMPAFSSVTLSPVRLDDSAFLGWGGACNVSGTDCTLNFDASEVAATVTFASNDFTSPE